MGPEAAAAAVALAVVEAEGVLVAAEAAAAVAEAGTATVATVVAAETAAGRTGSRVRSTDNLFISGELLRLPAFCFDFQKAGNIRITNFLPESCPPAYFFIYLLFSPSIVLRFLRN